MNKEVLFSSKNHDWETPNELYKSLDREFNFQLDLAANELNTKCKHYINNETDSLTLDWHIQSDGYMWLNPPYKDVKQWVRKCYLESKKGAKIVALLPARTCTRWFHDYIYRKHEIRFLKGRLKFKLNGEESNSAPFPSMVIIFNYNEDK